MLGLIVLALLAQIKTTYLLFSFGTLLLIYLYLFFQKRFSRVILASFVCSFLALYLLAGQELSYLPAYLISSFHVVGGFTSAMSKLGSTREISGFLILVIVYFTIFFKLSYKSEMPFAKRIIMLALASALLFVNFKQGFTRHDAEHVISAWGGAMTPCFLLVLLARRSATSRYLYAIGVLFVSFVFIGSQNFADERGGRNLYKRAIGSYNHSMQSLYDTIFRFNQNRLNIETKYARAMAQLASTSPIEHLDGSVDIIDSRQGQLVASNVSYSHRPVFQEYSAYTPYLQALNQNFFTERSPDYILMAPSAIDGRLPMFAEASSWPVFWEHYTVDRLLPAHLLLKRAKAPVQMQDRFLVKKRVDFNEAIALDSSDWIYARFNIKKSLLGSVFSFLYNLLSAQTKSDFSRF